MSGLSFRAGALKLGAFALLITGLVVPSFGGCGLVTSGSETTPAAPKCESAIHCDDANPCTIDVCGDDGLCVATPVEGDPPSQPSGDCLRVTCQAGVPTAVPDDADVDDGNACTADLCQNGAPTHTNADGDPCVLGSGSGVCKAGACAVSCASASDSCDDTNPCTEDACDVELGECVHDPQKLHGTLVSDRDQGDCTEERCKNGVATKVPDDSEIPNDSNDCTADACVASSPVHTPIAINTGCGLVGGMYCDGAGKCVQCNDPTQCGTDDDCNTFTCDAKVCGVVFTAAGTAVSAQNDGDCQVIQCNGSGGVMSADDDSDLPDDTNDCTNDICTAGVSSHTNVSLGAMCSTVLGSGSCDGAGICKKSQGSLCALAIECSTGFCTDGRCCGIACTAPCKSCGVAGSEGTCSNIAQFTEDSFPANACNGANSCDGAGTCKKDNGQSCAVAGDCTSGNCVDGRCCNSACTATCMACNVGGLLGTCANIPSLTEDDFPANACAGASSCDGTGNCRADNGQACAAAVECASGNCVDGYCCNSGCTGACKACNIAGSLGTCSNIAALTEDNFPANICVGVNSCDGAGSCKEDNGQACAAASECASGNCVDGRCCNNACTTTCMACNVAGSLGTCSNIPQLTEDSFPANACVGTSSCDGAGSCRKDNGQICALATECSSGNCVDGRCCNNACTTTCMACNVAASLGTCTNVPQLAEDNFPANACVGTSSCDGAGSCKEDNGQACAVAADCASGNCVDGRCCDTACAGTCKACNVAALEGTCSNIPAFTEDNFPANTCVGVSSCDGAGACKKDNGQSCTLASECTSASCVDGYCCNSACSGACKACNIAGSLGVCSNIPQFTEDNFPANICSGANSCDGAGACRKDTGQICALASECASVSCVDGRCCDSGCTGLCKACNVAGFEGTCSNILALGEDDFPAGSCTGINSCDGAGNCTKDNGQTCSAASECSSGNCVDGRCCNSGCGSTCKACNVVGLEGTCSNVPALVEDTFPANACTGVNSCDGAGTCKEDNGQTCTLASECSSGSCVDGYCCDGACSSACSACNIAGSLGACSPVALGAEDTFPANACVGVNSCNGSGTCTKDNGQACAAAAECTNGSCVDGYCCDSACSTACMACNVGGSLGTCSNMAQFAQDNFPANACVGVNSCNGTGTCTKGNGEVCLAAAECSSGSCVDGFCCDTACAGNCEACSAAKKGSGANGVCGFVAGGSDPDDNCADAGAASCGNDGFCDGAGLCRKYAAGTVCLASSCAGSTQTNASTCDGSGTCNTNGTTPCAPFICGPTACLAMCAMDSDCLAGFYCTIGGACQAVKAGGAACAGANECSSMSCVDGVCCDTACAGNCEACSAAKKGSGADGVCGFVADGSDPDDNCTDAGAASCGNDGFCNGAGLCRKYAVGTECVAASCSVATQTQHSQATCDGAGTCSAQVDTPCTPYVCGPAACLMMCASDGDCANGNYCNVGVCEVKLTNGTACMSDNECTSNFCTDGFCCTGACDLDCESCANAMTGAADGTCAPVTVGLTDDAPVCSGTMACNGAGVCLLANNEICVSNGDCASNNCVNVPPKTCMP